MLRSEWVNDNSKVNSNVQNCHLSCRAREVTDYRSTRRLCLFDFAWQTNSVCPSASTKRTAEQNFIVYDLNRRNHKPLPYCETRPLTGSPQRSIVPYMKCLCLVLFTCYSRGCCWFSFGVKKFMVCRANFHFLNFQKRTRMHALTVVSWQKTQNKAVISRMPVVWWFVQ